MKHVFPVNLAQIRSAVHEVFDSQTNKTNKKVIDNAKNRTLRSSLRAVKITLCDANNTARAKNCGLIIACAITALYDRDVFQLWKHLSRVVATYK